MRFKKVFAQHFLLILVFILVAAQAGCGNKNAGKDMDSKKELTENKSNEVEETDTAIETDYDELIDLGIPPVSVSLTKFMDMKGVAYEMLDPMTETIEESGNFMAGLAILPLFMADLSILPLTMIGALPSKSDTVWEGDLILLFNGTGRVELNGELSTFSMEIESDEEGKENLVINGNFDQKKDSMQVSFTTNGKETIFFEYVASDNGYVSQLYSENEDAVSLIRNAFNENRLYSSIVNNSEKPESIYQKEVGNWEDFVKSDELMVVLEDGKGYSIIDGEKYDF